MRIIHVLAVSERSEIRDRTKNTSYSFAREFNPHWRMGICHFKNTMISDWVALSDDCLVANKIYGIKQQAFVLFIVYFKEVIMIIISLFDAEKYGVPNNFDEVINKVIELEELETALSPNIIAFAKEAEEYCKIYEGFDEESLNHCIEEQETAVVNIELSSDYSQILLNYLIDIALKHRLVCFIEELVIAFVPPAQIYPPAQAELWQDIKENVQQQIKKPKTLDQFKNLVESLFDKILSQYNFVKILVRENYCQFLRIHGDIHQIIQINVQQTSKGFLSFIQFTFYFDDVQKIRCHFNFKERVSKGNRSYNFYFGLADINLYAIKLYEVFNKKPSETKLRPVIDEILKILDPIQNLCELDKFIDSDLYQVDRVLQGQRMSSEIPDILILSKLTNHPDFEKRVLLAETAPAQIWGWGEDRVIYPQELKKLIKYLREEVNPIIERNPPSASHVKQIPSIIQKYLYQQMDDILKRGKTADWDTQLNFNFWQIADNQQLLNFLTFGLYPAINMMLKEVKDGWKKDPNDDTSYQDALLLIEKQQFSKLPEIYEAIYRIFKYFADYRIHGASLLGALGEKGMQDVVNGFRKLGLKELAEAYEEGLRSGNYFLHYPDVDNVVEAAAIYEEQCQHFIIGSIKRNYEDQCQYTIIGGFEEKMSFNITQQHIDVAEAVRKNYQLFLV